MNLTKTEKKTLNKLRYKSLKAKRSTPEFKAKRAAYMRKYRKLHAIQRI